MSEGLRILVADDHEVVRAGLRLILEREAGWTICGEAADGTQAVDEAIRLKPDIVLLDISMPGINGLDATPLILAKVPEAKVLILSAHDSERLIRQMLSSGARGYLLKTDAGRDLRSAVESVSLGRLFFTASVSDVVLNDYLKRLDPMAAMPSDSPFHLTLREREIIQLLAEGKTNKEVAAHIHTSVKTVENYRARLMKQLNFRSLSDLVRYAIQHELLLP